MTKEEFVAMAITQLPKIRNPQDLQSVKLNLENLHDMSMTILDAIAYCKCLEEVNPDLAEKEALQRMDSVLSKYGRKGLTTF